VFCSTGKFKQVVGGGETITLLDITKCLYDVISRMEKVVEQRSVVAAATVAAVKGTNASVALIFKILIFNPLHTK
jgi:hypothetical protein